jgi:hypothetical protein
MTFYSDGKQAAEFLRIRARLFSGIEKVIRDAQEDGQIRSNEDASIIARHVFLVFAGALRWWIATRNPNPAKGLADLRRLFELQISGLVATPAKRARSNARRRSSAKP